MTSARQVLGEKVRFETDSYKCAEGADALALMTEWHAYRRPNFDKLKKLMRQPVVFDGRNQWEPAALRAAGFTYYGIGRGKG
jgi:UDPglucose 6-dehydrogenase